MLCLSKCSLSHYTTTNQHKVCLIFLLCTFWCIAWGEATRVPHMGYFSGQCHFPYFGQAAQETCTSVCPLTELREGVLLLPASQKGSDTQTTEGEGRDGYVRMSSVSPCVCACVCICVCVYWLWVKSVYLCGRGHSGATFYRSYAALPRALGVNLLVASLGIRSVTWWIQSQAGRNYKSCKQTEQTLKTQTFSYFAWLSRCRLMPERVVTGKFMLWFRLYKIFVSVTCLV